MFFKCWLAVSRPYFVGGETYSVKTSSSTVLTDFDLFLPELGLVTRCVKGESQGGRLLLGSIECPYGDGESLSGWELTYAQREGFGELWPAVEEARLHDVVTYLVP